MEVAFAEYEPKDLNGDPMNVNGNKWGEPLKRDWHLST